MMLSPQIEKNIVISESPISKGVPVQRCESQIGDGPSILSEQVTECPYLAYFVVFGRGFLGRKVRLLGRKVRILHPEPLRFVLRQQIQGVPLVS